MDMKTPADLLAAIPALINREPENMLVLITIKDNQMQAALGMQHCPDMDEMADYIVAILHQMAEIRPDALAMVFYTDMPADDEGREPYEIVETMIRLSMETFTPMDVTPGILVRGGKFHMYGTDHWHDIEEVKHSELAAEMVLHGIPLEPEGLKIPEPTAATDEVTAAIDAQVEAIPEFPPLMKDTWVLDYVTESRALYESILSRGFGATEDEAVRLIADLQNPVIRDRLMVDTLTASMDPQEFGEAITGNSKIMPDIDRVESAASLLDNLMQWTCDRHRLPLLVVQAWMSWMKGRTLDAETYLTYAESVDPGYKMALAFHRYIKDIKRIPDGIAHGAAE